MGAAVSTADSQRLGKGASARAQQIARARSLRDEGRVLREIAEEMDVAISTVHDWLSDPHGSKLKARKQRYAGECVNCGAPTSGYAGHGPNAPKRCARCSSRQNRERQKERARERRERVERLWAEGKTASEIGALLGWRGNAWSNICTLRNERGYDLPRRRRPNKGSFSVRQLSPTGSRAVDHYRDHAKAFVWAG